MFRFGTSRTDILYLGKTMFYTLDRAREDYNLSEFFIFFAIFLVGKIFLHSVP